MTEGIAIVLLARLLIPLLIFRRPFLGGALALLVDIPDRNIIDFFGWGSLDFDVHYQPLDKILDMYYLSIEFYVSRGWKEKTLRETSAILFYFRAAGALAFLLSGARLWLFFFPNIFEIFFLFVSFSKKYLKPAGLLMSSWFPAVFIIIAGILKLIHEYHLHVGNLSDLIPWL